MTALEANQRLLVSACDTLTPAIPVKQRNVSSTEKSEGKTRNLIFENFQVSNELLFVACFSGGIVMPGVFS